MSADEKILLIAALGYIAVATIWILTLHMRARLMLLILCGAGLLLLVRFWPLLKPSFL